jgi:REP element-mobilizing transposase RayT
MEMTVHKLCFHIVLGTADRRPLIPPSVRHDLYRLFEEVTEKSGGTVLGIGGIPNHVHLLIRLPPSVMVAKIVRELKTASRSWALTTGAGNLEWGEGFGAFSVSQERASELLDLVEDQEGHHRHRSYAYELLALMSGGAKGQTPGENAPSGCSERSPACR